MVAHANLSNANLHEPKGIATASDDFVLTATSNASVWKKITVNNIDATSVFNVNKHHLAMLLPDPSTANSFYMVMPVACTVTKVWTVIHDAITTADEVLTVRDNAGSSMGTITITQSGSAVGDVDSLEPASNNTFTAGQTLRIDSSGASSGAIVTVTVEYTQTA